VKKLVIGLAILFDYPPSKGCAGHCTYQRCSALVTPFPREVLTERETEGVMGYNEIPDKTWKASIMESLYKEMIHKNERNFNKQGIILYSKILNYLFMILSTW
jgi:hypothetical protein